MVRFLSRNAIAIVSTSVAGYRSKHSTQSGGLANALPVDARNGTLVIVELMAFALLGRLFST